MGKMLLIFVLLFVNVSVVQETEGKKENASKLLSNSVIMFSHLTIISVMLILIISIIMHTKRVLIDVAYKLQDLCTTYWPMSCAIILILVTVSKTLGILLSNMHINFFQEFLMGKYVY